MSDPVEFLKTRHARMEKLVQALPDGPWGWHGHNGSEGRYVALEGPQGSELPAIRSASKDEHSSWLERHPAFDEYLPEPDAVLRRVEAERAILAEHQPKTVLVPPIPGTSLTGLPVSAPVCKACGGNVPTTMPHISPAYPCRTVQLLAQAWGWEADRG